MTSRGVIAIARWTFSILALAGIVLVYQRWIHVNPTTVALTFLLYILALASIWSLRLAVVTSILATFCYNFFFLPPIRTLTVADPQNWLALFTFLVTAVIGSRLSRKARDEAEEARSRQKELEVLFALSREMLAIDNVAALIEVIPKAVVATTNARSVVLYLMEEDRMFQAGTERVANLERAYLQEITQANQKTTIFGEDSYIGLKVGVKPRGTVMLRGAKLSEGALEAIGGIISVSLDRAKALEELAHGEATKESERLRSLMIDSITHELRTPLTSIKGAATVLLTTETLKEEDRHELLTVIDEECDRINRLVSQAVEMAQLDAKQVHMQFEPVDIAVVVEEARRDCSYVEHQHPLEIHIDQSVQVLADVRFLKKAICNLLENAAKYSAGGSPIIVTASVQQDQLIVSVADRGIGIEPSEQGLIFDRFYRAPIHNQRVSGTGMGLSISQAIVQAHKGQLGVVSRPEEGSVFSFTMPVFKTGDASQML